VFYDDYNLNQEEKTYLITHVVGCERAHFVVRDLFYKRSTLQTASSTARVVEPTSIQTAVCNVWPLYRLHPVPHALCGQKFTPNFSKSVHCFAGEPEVDSRAETRTRRQWPFGGQASVNPFVFGPVPTQINENQLPDAVVPVCGIMQCYDVMMT
jgi:hypothetical protein